MDEILRRHPDRVPVKIHKESDFDIDRKKYLIPRDMTLGNFVTYIRSRIKVKPYEAVFVLAGGVLPPISSTFETIYNAHASEDKLLYVVLKKENTFG